MIPSIVLKQVEVTGIPEGHKVLWVGYLRGQELFFLVHAPEKNCQVPKGHSAIDVFDAKLWFGRFEDMHLITKPIHCHIYANGGGMVNVDDDTYGFADKDELGGVSRFNGEEIEVLQVV